MDDKPWTGFDPENTRRVSVEVRANATSKVRSNGTYVRKGRNGRWQLALLPIIFAMRNLDMSPEARLQHLVNVMEQLNRKEVIVVCPALQSIHIGQLRKRIRGEIDASEVPLPYTPQMNQ